MKAIQTIAEQGRICILDIEMEVPTPPLLLPQHNTTANTHFPETQGVKQIRTHPDFSHRARFLFLSPPSPDVLEQRLRGRKTDSEDAIQKRLKQAVNEMEYAKTPGVHDKVVVNDDLDRAYEEVRAWVVEE